MADEYSYFERIRDACESNISLAGARSRFLFLMSKDLVAELIMGRISVAKDRFAVEGTPMNL